MKDFVLAICVMNHRTGRRNSSITRAYHARKSAILRAIYTQITRALRASKKNTRNYV